MNKVELTGRLTKDPDIRITKTREGEDLTVARYTIAVDRRFNRSNDQSADFIPCVAFGKTGDFVKNYLKKGIKIGIVGSIQSSSYTDKEGKKHFPLEIVVEEHEFEESKKSSGGDNVENEYNQTAASEGFSQLNNVAPEDLPFPKEKKDNGNTSNEKGFMSIPQETYDDIPYKQD